MESVAFWAGATLYAAATAAFFAWLAFRRPALARFALLAALAALVPHGLALALRWAEVGHGPFSTRYEVLSANAFLLVVVYVVAVRIAPALRGLGALVLPAAFLLLGLSVDSFALKSEVPIIFKSYWLYLHIGFAKLFGATTILAAACAAGYLAKARERRFAASLPSPARLDLYAHQLLLLAFLCLGVMIAAGSLWAHQSWGRYWAWDPIETSSLATWIVFGLILHLRVLHGWTGARMAYLTFVALALTVVTVYVVTLAAPTIHTFYLVGTPP
ncbi:MAG: cytochrome c biogenesis protein CcsA [Deltaproteobacteria bacterium]|nr:cytochrome c biogenesis protein CcsA [Deltaproteobacteria bacterium]